MLLQIQNRTTGQQNRTCPEIKQDNGTHYIYIVSRFPVSRNDGREGKNGD